MRRKKGWYFRCIFYCVTNFHQHHWKTFCFGSAQALLRLSFLPFIHRFDTLASSEAQQKSVKSRNLDGTSSQGFKIECFMKWAVPNFFDGWVGCSLMHFVPDFLGLLVRRFGVLTKQKWIVFIQIQAYSWRPSWLDFCLNSCLRYKFISLNFRARLVRIRMTFLWSRQRVFQCLYRFDAEQDMHCYN